jgi:hypothetical protein
MEEAGSAGMLTAEGGQVEGALMLPEGRAVMHCGVVVWCGDGWWGLEGQLVSTTGGRASLPFLGGRRNSLLTEGLVEVVLVDGDGRHGGFGVSREHAIGVIRLRQNAVSLPCFESQEILGVAGRLEHLATIRNPGPPGGAAALGRGGDEGVGG